MRRQPFRSCLLLALGLAALLLVAPAARAGAPRGGRVVLSIPGGGTGPLELLPTQGSWIGTFTVTNLGAEPLVVSRIAIRGDEVDVRSPPRLSVHFVDGPTTNATLAPGAAKDVVVAWMPDRDPRVRQAFGQVIVTSTDEESGEVAMGFRAQLPTGVGWLGAHVLSALVCLPLLVIALILGLRAAGRVDHPLVGRVALGTCAGELLLAAMAYRLFAPGVGRQDGNDGFQLVERSVWVRSIGAEWYVGIDGLSVALVLLTAIVAFVAVVAPASPPRRTDSYFAALALLTAALMGALVALDLVVLVASLATALVSILLLVGGWGGSRSVHAAAKAAVYGALAAAALLTLVAAMYRASGRAFLVDGTTMAHSLALPELGRTAFASHAVLGVPAAAGMWVLLFVVVAVVAPLPPLHGWLADALEESPAGGAILVAGAATLLGPYLLVRIGMNGLGEAAPWAGPWVATLGALAALYGALGAMAQRTLRRFVAFAALTSSGTCVFGIGSLTTQGIAGAVTSLFAHGISVCLLLGVAGALEGRGSRRALEGLEQAAVGRRAPRLAALLGAGLALSLGVPCFAGFWGPFLVLLGGFGAHPALALALAAALVPFAGAHVRVARFVLGGASESPSPRSLADARPRELAALAPLVLLALLLGLWPAPLLSQIATGASDASAAAGVEAAEAPTP